MRGGAIAVFLALVVALVGPRLVGPQSHRATEPFAYVPPDGFVERPASSAKVDAAGARAWELPGDDVKVRPVVVVTHSKLEMQVDEPSLGKLVGDMPQAFEDCTWTHRRHEMRARPDGARVGLIEGDCEREVDLGGLGLPKAKAKLRKLQLVFPEDEGTAIATISYPADQAARWEPAFEATIDRAKGVATRVPPPSTSQHLAWGLGALVLGGLAVALVRRKGRDAK